MDATFASTAPSGSDAADATPDRAPRWITRDTAGIGSSSPSSRLSRSSIPVGSSSPPWKSAWSRARSRASHRANTSLDPISRVFTATSASKSTLASFHSTGYGPFSSMLSIAMTLAPLRRRRSTTWLPMNPAAPVTSQAPSSGSTPRIVDELSPADADITRALLRRAVRAAGCIPRRRGAWYRSVAASVACADMPTGPPRGDGMASRAHPRDDRWISSDENLGRAVEVRENFRGDAGAALRHTRTRGTPSPDRRRERGWTSSAKPRMPSAA